MASSRQAAPSLNVDPVSVAGHHPASQRVALRARPSADWRRFSITCALLRWAVVVSVVAMIGFPSVLDRGQGRRGAGTRRVGPSARSSTLSRMPRQKMRAFHDPCRGAVAGLCWGSCQERDARQRPVVRLQRLLAPAAANTGQGLRSRPGSLGARRQSTCTDQRTTSTR